MPRPLYSNKRMDTTTDTIHCRKIEPIIIRDSYRLIAQFCGRCERDLEATANGYRHLTTSKDAEAHR